MSDTPKMAAQFNAEQGVMVGLFWVECGVDPKIVALPAWLEERFCHLKVRDVPLNDVGEVKW